MVQLIFGRRFYVCPQPINLTLKLDLSHVWLGVLPQPHGGPLETGCQKLYMTTEGVMNPFWGFINEVTKVFLVYWRIHVWLYWDLVVKRCVMGLCWEIFIIMFGCIFVCMFVRECRRILLRRGRHFILCAVTYIRDQMKTLHSVICGWWPHRGVKLHMGTYNADVGGSNILYSGTTYKPW